MIKAIISTLMLFLIFIRTVEASYKVAFPQGDFSPQYNSSTGQMLGFLPEVMERFANDSGNDFVLQSFPIKRYQLLLKSSQIDFILPSNPAWSDKTAGEIVYSSAIMNSRLGFVRKKEFIGKPVTRVATIRGYTLPELTSAQKLTNYSEYFTPKISKCMKLLKLDRVDSVYAHSDFVRSWLNKNNLNDYLVFDPSLSIDDYSYHLATISHKEIILEFNKWLFENQITIKQLMKKYGVGSEPLLE